MIRRALDDLLAAQAAHAAQPGVGSPYLEFLRSGSLSAGLYVLDRGATDAQQPHAEDEVYVVVRGRGRFTAARETRDARAGDIIYVAAGVEHRFHDIAEQLVLVVVFAPPEGSAAS